MSRRSWPIYPGGWVRTTYPSKRFIPDDPVCEMCRRASCGPYWFHVERKVVRCYRCQTEDRFERERKRKAGGAR